MNETRILIVDDDEDIRSNMSDILGDMGYLTSAAANGPEALELMSREQLRDRTVGSKNGWDGWSGTLPNHSSNCIRRRKLF